MTTYDENSSEPGPEVAEVWDTDGDRWQRNPTRDGGPSGWIQRDTPTEWGIMLPAEWKDVVNWAPLTDEPPAPESSAITPEIRMWALDFVLRATQLVAEHGTVEPGIELLTAADNYARYVLTGEHFE